MSRPSARVGRNRRRAFLYAPLLAVGLLLILAATPVNGQYVLGAIIMMIGPGGFILEPGEQSADSRS